MENFAVSASPPSQVLLSQSFVSAAILYLRPVVSPNEMAIKLFSRQRGEITHAFPRLISRK
jgi:hypothetical protein